MTKGSAPLQIIASMQINSLRSILKQACGVHTLAIVFVDPLRTLSLHGTSKFLMAGELGCAIISSSERCCVALVDSATIPVEYGHPVIPPG